MSDSSPSASSNGPPHRPRLRERIALNRKYQPISREDQIAGFRGLHERGYLPHRDAPGLTQFVTFRLADAFPAELRHEWEQLLTLEDHTERRAQLEAYLDLGRGECWLRDPRLAELTANAFKHFDGQRYRLIAWCVMPNHAHVLFETTTTPMGEIIESWKRFTSTHANKLLGRRGPFWQEDYWDTFMRNSEHESSTIHYMENNPRKAGLERWPWRSSIKTAME